MKTKRLLLAVACLLLLAATGQTQVRFSQIVLSQPSPARVNFASVVQQTLEEAFAKGYIKQSLRMFWEGQGVGVSSGMLLDHPNILAALDISEEQQQQMNASFEIFANSPGTLKTANEFETAVRAISRIPMPNIHDETAVKEYITKIEGKMMFAAKQMVLFLKNAADVDLKNHLLPEQLRKVQEMHLVAMKEKSMFISPSAFEALGLSDTQRQEAERIKKELEPKFEKLLEDVTKNQMILERRLNSEQAKDVRGREDNPESRDALRKQLLTECPEYKRIYEKIQSLGKAFFEQFKIKMVDVLTDEQRKQLQELFDNPPEHARIYISNM